MKKQYLRVVVAVWLMMGISGMAQAYDPSANALYSSWFNGSEFIYNVTIENTAIADFDIYTITFGYRFGDPLDPNHQTFMDTSLVSSPRDWNSSVPATYGGNAFWSTTASSAYILAGTSLGGFVFSSPTAPPSGAPFGVSFYDNQGGWGYSFGGTATYTGSTSPVPIPGAVWLVGSGLIGLVGFKRKLRKP